MNRDARLRWIGKKRKLARKRSLAQMSAGEGGGVGVEEDPFRRRRTGVAMLLPSRLGVNGTNTLRRVFALGTPTPGVFAKECASL